MGKIIFLTTNVKQATTRTWGWSRWLQWIWWEQARLHWARRQSEKQEGFISLALFLSGKSESWRRIVLLLRTQAPRWESWQLKSESWIVFSWEPTKASIQALRWETPWGRCHFSTWLGFKQNWFQHWNPMQFKVIFPVPGQFFVWLYGNTTVLMTIKEDNLKRVRMMSSSLKFKYYFISHAAEESSHENEKYSW